MGTNGYFSIASGPLQRQQPAGTVASCVWHGGYMDCTSPWHFCWTYAITHHHWQSSASPGLWGESCWRHFSHLLVFSALKKDLMPWGDVTWHLESGPMCSMPRAGTVLRWPTLGSLYRERWTCQSNASGCVVIPAARLLILGGEGMYERP